jgi:hypothetical protein
VNASGAHPVWPITLLFATCLLAQGQETPRTLSQDSYNPVPIKASLCQLVGQPEPYNGKEVVVRALYNHGYGWSVLHSPECSACRRLDLSQVKDKASAKKS